MDIGTIVFWLVIIGIPLYVIMIYNGLVAGRNQFKNGFAQIDVQLQRRYELIPNLVETAKGYIKHERETLEAVIAARNQAYNAERAAAARPDSAQAIAALNGAESVLGAAMSRLMVVAEAYPELKANETMKGLMEELASTENRVAFASQHFNDSVMEYNNSRERFPNNFVAGPFGFTRAEHLALESAEARQPVKVSFTG